MQIRLGANVSGSESAGWLDICRRVEAVGLDEIGVADHLVTGSGRDGDASLEDLGDVAQALRP